MNKKQAAFWVIICVGTLLRFIGLASQSVWEGEYMTAALSTGGNIFYVLFNSLENAPHPPLFYLLEHAMVSIFGMSEFSIRLLPAIFGLINIFVFYKLVRSFFSEKVSAIAVTLFAFNPLQLYYSQEAGPYSMYLMVSMLMIYYFIMSIKYNSFVFGPFTVWSVIGLYTHENAVILLLILNFIIFVTNRKDIRLLPWIQSQAIILAAWIPLALVSIRPEVQAGVSAAVAKAGILLAPLYSLKSFFFGAALPVNWVITACVIICLVFAVLGVMSKRKATEKRLLDTLAMIIAAVTVVQWLTSLGNPAAYSDRNIMIAAALMLLILAVGVSYMSDIGLALFILMITAVYGFSIFNYYLNPQYAKIDYRQIYKKVSAQAVAGSLIIHTSKNSWQAFEFYGNMVKKAWYVNRLRSEPREETAKGMQASIREMRKNFRENLNRIFKLGLAGPPAENLVSAEEMKTLAPAYKRAFFIIDSVQGLRQPYLPQQGIYDARIDLEPPPAPESVWWVREYFNIKEKISVFGCDAYALEKK